MIKQVTQYGEEVLRQVADIAIDNENNRKIIQDLKDTLNEIPNGAGLAAPQIGESVRIFATRNYRDEKRDDILIFVNPQIIEESEQTIEITDGCLSIPNVAGTTVRNSFIKVSYLNENFEVIEEELEGFQSVVFQHENDHLNGVLFIDRLGEGEAEKIDEMLEKKANGENLAYMGGKIVSINIQASTIEGNE